MKKTLSLIFFICFLIFLAGCGNDQYAIEKQSYQVQKQAEKIFKNPHASPPQELERAVNLLNSFINKYPKNNLTVESEFTIARLYIVKEEYDKARAQLKMLINKYSGSKDICAEATFSMGNSYEIEDKWGLALQEYRKVMQEYPTTLRGFDIPVYIAQHYKVKYQPDKMITAYQEAIGHYTSLAGKYPNTPLAYNAHTLVAQCYVAMKDWQNAISSLKTIIDNYKGRVNLDGVMMDMAMIYNKELKDKVKAKEILERLIKEYPRGRLINLAKALLKELEKK